MKRQLENNFWTAFTLLATLIGFIADLVALYVLFAVNEIGQTSARIVLSPVFKFGLWLVALITYMGFLQKYWVLLSRKPYIRPSQTYIEFLTKDLIDLQKFRHSLVLIPAPLFFVFLFQIISQLNGVEWFILLTPLAPYIIYKWAKWLSAYLDESSYKREQVEKHEWELFDDERYYKVWMERISKQLEEYGFASSIMLSYLYTQGEGLVYKAMWCFFERNEIPMDLAFLNLNYSHMVGSNMEYRYFQIICSREDAQNGNFVTEVIESHK
ncbi:MAG: hypothetical protein EPO32_11640 [Anaerolineae bacterium]|nr:MAG: hypothetical protein EPO32_11640 [Anaerolineae bacterium]